jgi:molybdenum cofactor cytidylyltransferase
VVAVLGATADEAQRFATGAEVVVAEDWAQGQGCSLSAGLAALAGTDAESVVITLVDQPLLTPAAIARVIGQAGDAAAAVATYDGRQGHPVLLRRSVWAEVAASAEGDVGARAWLRAHPDRVARVACDGLARPDDIDTTADLAESRVPVVAD